MCPSPPVAAYTALCDFAFHWKSVLPVLHGSGRLSHRPGLTVTTTLGPGSDWSVSEATAAVLSAALASPTAGATRTSPQMSPLAGHTAASSKLQLASIGALAARMFDAQRSQWAAGSTLSSTGTGTGTVSKTTAAAATDAASKSKPKRRHHGRHRHRPRSRAALPATVAAASTTLGADAKVRQERRAGRRDVPKATTSTSGSPPGSSAPSVAVPHTLRRRVGAAKCTASAVMAPTSPVHVKTRAADWGRRDIEAWRGAAPAPPGVDDYTDVDPRRRPWDPSHAFTSVAGLSFARYQPQPLRKAIAPANEQNRGRVSTSKHMGGLLPPELRPSGGALREARGKSKGGLAFN